MEHNVVILVDDKQKMLESLRAGLDEAKEYVELCRRVLIDDYGADGIDGDTLTECCFGHLVTCAMQDKSLTPAAEYVSQQLSGRSNYGLRKFGLTRAQYDKALKTKPD